MKTLRLCLVLAAGCLLPAAALPAADKKPMDFAAAAFRLFGLVEC